MTSFRADIVQVDEHILCDFVLHAEIPVLRVWHLQLRIQQYRVDSHPVLDYPRGNLICGEGNVGDHIQRQVKEILLERRVASRVSKQVPEDAIVENTICSANRRLALLER